MAGKYEVFVQGLDALEAFDGLDERTVTNARQAVNKATDRARTRAQKAIEQQVAFPAGYLSPSKGRLTVSQKATNANLEGRVRGQQRPTMLARFMTGTAPRRGEEGVSVQVKPGKTTRLKRAFVIKLPGKKMGTETLSNLGIAVRLKPGETLRAKKKKISNSKNLYLLYGPSVDQVFRTVAGDEAPKAAEFLEQEFSRLMDRKK